MNKEIQNAEVALDEEIKEVVENEQSESNLKTSDEENWEACEFANVDFQPVDADLKKGIQLVLEAADAVKDFTDAKDEAEKNANVASKAVLVIQACVALLHFYKLKPAVVIDILEATGIDFPANMGFERRVVETVVRESGCKVSGGTKSKFGGCVRFLINKDIPTEGVPSFIEKVGGWTKLYDLYRKKVEAPQKKEEQRLKKLEDANTIRHLETETQPIGNVMADKSDDTEIRDQFAGFDSSLSIMVVRRTDDDVLEVLGRLAADEIKAEQLICQFGLFEPSVTPMNDNDEGKEKFNANS
ncbi:hypothetical protein GCM10011332_32390 [Terasakiella brassicae]|uniref:Uncharacterized protein n=1 Tax=Terasakiella brassicae TaxID=1634917 RepID=A0A917FEI4_9PROT|nr:hypothetical protein [Terasakiella brassicae]GGF75933.1 hypothetical protein GCM10011332_32390 [Terasakiella brassicae]